MDEQQQTAPSPGSETERGTTPDPGSDDTAADPALEVVTVTYEGLSWVVPKDRGQWDMNVQFEFEDGRRLIGTCILLGGGLENVQKIRSQINTVCRTANDVDRFQLHIAEILNKECVG